jgi:hypothetical protein
MSYATAITTLIAIVALAGTVIANHGPSPRAEASTSIAPLHMVIPDNLPVGVADTSF